MATEFIDSFDFHTYLTSEVRSVRARTDKSKIDVSLVCESGPAGYECFFSATLHAFDGVVELADFGSLIEEYFRLRGKVEDMITINFDDVSIDGVFLYCEHTPLIDFNPEESLLLAVASQRVHPGSIVVWASVNFGEAIPFNITAVGPRASDGLPGLVSWGESHHISDTHSLWFSVDSIVRKAMSGKQPLSAVSYFSIEHHGLRKSCYIVPDASVQTFTFRNIFNVTEFIDIVGTVTDRTDVRASTAVCGGRLMQYDRDVTKVFQVVTGGIPPGEAPLFEQFLSSREVCVCINGDEYPVIISDVTCEPSDDDSALDTYKFTWRFTSDRPVMTDPVTAAGAAARRNVFSEQFSEEYD